MSDGPHVETTQGSPTILVGPSAQGTMPHVQSSGENTASDLEKLVSDMQQDLQDKKHDLQVALDKIVSQEVVIVNLKADLAKMTYKSVPSVGSLTTDAGS